MVDVGAVEEIVGNLKKFNLRMESPELEFAIRKTIEKMMYEFSKAVRFGTACARWRGL